MKVLFLTHSVDNVGGTIRATLNTASALVDLGHEVEIAAVFRRRREPVFALDDRVTVWPLVDMTRRSGPLAKWRARRPSRLYPPGDTRTAQFHRLTDRRVAEFLAASDADVIVGTRPGLNVYVAGLAPRHAVTVGQEHLFLDHHKPRLRAAIERRYRLLDAVVTVSAADADNYRRRIPSLADRMYFIPNSIPPSPLPPSTGDAKLIMAAGRIESPKRFDVLLKAFAAVHERHPDWRLRIYGSGSQLGKLRDLATRLGLDGAAVFMGQKTPLDTEWVKSSIAASTSRHESFGLTLVEAMDCGLPVVSTACPYGPPEIITDGSDGILTPVNDADAVASGLCRLIENPELRRHMAEAARHTAADYHPEAIGRRYEELFTSLLDRSATPAPRRRRRRPRYRPYPTAQRHTVAATAVDFGAVTLTGRSNLQVTLDGTVHNVEGEVKATDLSEGEWAVTDRGEPVRAGRVDTRALLEVKPMGDALVIPFADRGLLKLRVWRRDDYAEIDDVSWEGAMCTVTGRLMSGRAPHRVLARARDASGTAITIPVEDDGDGRFSATVPTRRLCAAPHPDGNPLRLWDLWLDTDDGEVRLGRFFDDIPRRKHVQRFGTVHTNANRVQPYFTTHNELSIRVKQDQDQVP
ncbi:MAG TPA: glycosyltransferase family 4 protein [Candidatus Stackebrandtia excrementipullorum]|nr:glycosyltransferase family 4 protein [Candidatus Stackebrandtia excrementipullorum]